MLPSDLNPNPRSYVVQTHMHRGPSSHIDSSRADLMMACDAKHIHIAQDETHPAKALASHTQMQLDRPK